MRRWRCLAIWLAVLGSLGLMPAARAQVRIKDIADTEGIRTNQLVGYGLVVGLPGTGDKLQNAVFTKQSLIGMLERLGVNTRDQAANLTTKNVAAVLVTANLPAFARSGSQIDVHVSALGDASSLVGGTLVVTPLMGADGQVYAVAQGALSSAAFSASGQGASVVRNTPTVAAIPDGATVEKEVPFTLGADGRITLALRNPDFTTALRVQRAVNDELDGKVADVTDPRTIVLDLHGRDPVTTLERIEDLRVVPDAPAKVVIDEASGTIVMGDNVRISTVAIAQGNLTIRVTETPEVSQPTGFAGQTAVVPRTSINVSTQKDRKLGILRGTVTLRDLVSGLNAMGVSPRDLISILQAIKADGALQAELVVE